MKLGFHKIGAMSWLAKWLSNIIYYYYYCCCCCCFCYLLNATEFSPSGSSPYTYLLTPWCRVLLEKLTGLQLVKKFPAFHGTRKFITALTSIRHLSILGQPNPVHIPTSHLLEIHPNIIHPSTPRSTQWSPSLRFPQQDPNTPLSSPICTTCPAHLILLDLSPAKYWVRSTNHLAAHYAISSIPPLPIPPRSKYSPQYHVLKHP